MIFLKKIVRIMEENEAFGVLITSIEIGFFLIMSYGFANFINDFIISLNFVEKVLLSSILFLIFCWVLAGFIEATFYEKIEINSFLKECITNSVYLINALISILLVLLLLTVKNPYIFLIIYFVYILLGFVFIWILKNIFKCVIKKIKKKFSEDVLRELEYYFLGKYKIYLLIFQLICTSIIFIIYSLYHIKSILYCFPLIIIINESIYWNIRLKVYRLIDVYIKQNKTENRL